MYGDQEHGFSWKHANIVLKIVILGFPVALFLVWFYRSCTIPPRPATTRSTSALRTAASSSDAISRVELASIPTFVYSAKDSKIELECPVCLMEFKDGDEGRFLPGCLHKFHAECIDMWFLSHSTCPICRTDIHLDISRESIV